MYEYTYVRTPFQRALSINKRINAHLDLCHQIIADYTRDGWRFVTIIKPFGNNTASELVFERPVPGK